MYMYVFIRFSIALRYLHSPPPPGRESLQSRLLRLRFAPSPTLFALPRTPYINSSLIQNNDMLLCQHTFSPVRDNSPDDASRLRVGRGFGERICLEGRKGEERGMRWERGWGGLWDWGEEGSEVNFGEKKKINIYINMARGWDGYGSLLGHAYCERT